jgi:hypothetical protein
MGILKEYHITVHNEPSAEQCGQFPEAGIHQTCKR